MNDLQDVLKDFLVESYENLDQLDRDLLALEQYPTSKSTLSSIFRTIHTIKGTCGFLGLTKLESVTHVGENLLSRMRDGEISLRPDITTGLLSLVDAIRQILRELEVTGSEGEGEYAELVESLVALQQCAAAVDQRAAPSVTSAEPAIGSTNPMVAAAPATATEPVKDELGPSTPPTGPQSSDEESGSPGGTVAAQESRSGGVSDSTIRVDVGLLDKLMNRVGELVLARNQILQFAGSINDSLFLSSSQRLNLITTELQEGVMKTRMQPIGNIWGKFPRVVRDLAIQCGKQIRIEMEGRETELDKTIVEAIKDPLTHLVRNSVDHGIEKPEVRLAAGKAAEGCLRLRAFHEGGQVNIEISDDGGGLNLERIKQRALERGMITPDQANRMSEREISHLIFSPGFSTAAKITNVSGRGVGMDVVKTNIEKIGGTVDIQSDPGLGTTVRLKIPLTLAIIPALIVTCGGDRFAIPQVSLLELVRLDGEQASRGIEQLHGVPVYRLRGTLLPIVYLSRELGMPEPEPDKRGGAVNIVVLRADDRQFGLVVDAINDTEEIVVKPLSKQLKGIEVFAGSTIMGDGRVALILDVLGTAQRARVVSEVRDRGLAEHNTRFSDSAGHRQTLLILTAGGRRLALPISMVSRLEEIPLSEVETADGREVVQYRGQILPLLRLASRLGLPAADSEGCETLQVVVYSQEGRSVGLVVDRIVDIVDADVQIRRRAAHPGIAASAVVQDRVTDLLNIPALIQSEGNTLLADAISV